MSKNTLNSQFRKLNVNSDDEYDDVVSNDNVQGPNESEVTSLLNANNNAEALKLVLSSCPQNTKNQEVKDRALLIVMRVLQSFKPSEIESVVKTLEPTHLDILMKYVYRGFEIPSEGSSNLLLTWHEKVFAIGGLGSIVRVLTDRKKV